MTPGPTAPRLLTGNVLGRPQHASAVLGIAAGGADEVGKKQGVSVSENERRAADTLRASDLLIRGASVVILFLVALVAVLAIQPV